MNVGVQKTDDMFRMEMREFLRQALPEDMARRNRTAVHPTREDILGFTAILSRSGRSVPHWPREYGGTGWTPMQRYIFDEERVFAGAPEHNIQAISLVGPVIYTFGTEEQKRRFLPPIREGRMFWSQGFSEPNAGSDLASLKTRAVRDGDVYVVNGQKIWNSQSMMADWIFLLVRTDPAAKLQRGISFLLVPLDSPGITVRPIQSIDEGESLCEVFFDEVRVPVDLLVGEENKGWDYAKFLLGNERVATAEVPRNRRNLDHLKEIARSETKNGRPLIEDPDFRARIARSEVDLLALEKAVMQAVEAEELSPALPSVLKLEGTRLMQSILGLQVEALGSYGAAYYPQRRDEPKGGVPGPAYAPDVTAEFLFRRASTIYGGSNEVQRNILSKILLRADGGPRGPLGEDQRLLSDSIDRFVEKSYPFSARRQRLAAGAPASRAVWQTFAEAGWLGAALPESAGGLGGGPEDVAAIAEAFGRGLVAEPFIGCAVLAGTALAGAATGRTADLLGELVAGKTIVALAHDEPGARGVFTVPATRADARGEATHINGRKSLVLGGGLADTFLIPASEAGGVSLYIVDRDAPGLSVLPYRTIDGQLVADLVLENVAVDDAARVGAKGAAASLIETAIAHATLAACSDMLGAMEQSFWITRDYLNARKQFGSALAEFQALQHRLADMYVELELARAAIDRGMAALTDRDPSARTQAVSAAKSRLGRAGYFVTGEGIQLHGGIGMTEEYIIGHFFKRQQVLNILFGDGNHHAQVLAAAL